MILGRDFIHCKIQGLCGDILCDKTERNVTK